MVCWSTKQLDAFLQLLRDESFNIIGPVVRDDAVVYDHLESLPVGVGDTQEAGHYRLTRRGDRARFGFNLGPSTWKQYLFPPAETLFTVRDNVIASTRVVAMPTALIGVRACELAAIQVQDRVFLDGQYREPRYAKRREQLFIVAVNCSQAAATCFCTASHDGPSVGPGADLVLTEVNPEQPWYLVDARTEAARAMADRIGGDAATSEQQHRAAAVVDAAAAQMHRQLPRAGLRGALLDALEHPHWDDVADRCLACGNCTQVCPTCFCSTTAERTDLTTGEVSHSRLWDSCFTEMHSYTTGGAIHHAIRARYRQWLTHKLASWEDQYGTSGCTGCGRCISWCPVGIDITEEAAILRRPP